MRQGDYRIDAFIAIAQPDDFQAVRMLLAECALSFVDITKAMIENCLVVRCEDRLIACMSMQRYGIHALLWSLAVHDGARCLGWALKLVKAIEEHAKTYDISRMNLLTKTAMSFLIQLSYQQVVRANVPLVLNAIANLRTFFTRELPFLSSFSTPH